MRIAQVAPLYESVPPLLYGGTERVVSYLTEELVHQGHRVTLFASGDSVTGAELVPASERALRLDDGAIDPLARHILMLEQVRQREEDFDIIHYHVDYLHFPLSRRSVTPHVTTLHGRLDLPDLAPVYAEFRDMPVVSISHAQRAPLSTARWVATVHHGLPVGLHAPRFEDGSYFAFIGRISPEKRVDRAIAIATRTGIPLKIAAKVDAVDRRYYEQLIAPLLDNPLVEYVGEIDEREKTAFLGGAKALLFPIDWPEPFGLALIEAMATGTPVIAFRAGSVPEIVEDGVTGFIADDMEGAVARVERLPKLDRRRIRAEFERRYCATRMAQDYVHVYERLVGDRRAHYDGPTLSGVRRTALG